MTDKLTESVTPGLDNPAPLGPLAGDWRDDDGQVYEDDFEAADHGPVKVAGVPHKVDEIKPATRLMVVSAQVGTVSGTLSDPVMLLPADPRRKKLVIAGYANNKTFIVASSKSDCYNGGQIMSVLQNPNVNLDGHTGAVWAYSTDNTNVLVTAIAVTE